MTDRNKDAYRAILHLIDRQRAINRDAARATQPSIRDRLLVNAGIHLQIESEMRRLLRVGDKTEREMRSVFAPGRRSTAFRSVLSRRSA